MAEPEAVPLRSKDEEKQQQQQAVAKNGSNTFFKSYGSFIICTVIILVFILALVGIFTYQHYSALRMREPKLVMLPQTDDNVIALTSSNAKQWTDSIHMYLKAYNLTDPGIVKANSSSCDYGKQKKEGEVCDFDLRKLFPCIKEKGYGYSALTPCIFLRIDKGLNWRPDCFNDTKSLPDEMPNNLKNFIMIEKSRNIQLLNKVWISCEGVTPADAQNAGPIHYAPTRGFPNFYFPKEKLSTLSPIVAIYLDKPKSGVEIKIECQAWAKNIPQNKVTFTLSIN